MSWSNGIGTILRAVGKLLLLFAYAALRLAEVLASALGGLVTAILNK